MKDTIESRKIPEWQQTLKNLAVTAALIREKIKIENRRAKKREPGQPKKP